MGIGSTYNTITFNTREGNLYGNVLVGQTYDQTILGCIVLVFILEDQAFASIVIGFTLTTPAELNLVALEVLLVLDYFNETLKITSNKTLFINIFHKLHTNQEITLNHIRNISLKFINIFHKYSTLNRYFKRFTKQ